MSALSKTIGAKADSIENFLNESSLFALSPGFETLDFKDLDALEELEMFETVVNCRHFTETLIQNIEKRFSPETDKFFSHFSVLVPFYMALEEGKEGFSFAR